MGRKLDKAYVWEIIAAVATIVGVVVTIAISVHTYNTRYDSDCRAADGIKLEYKSNQNKAASSLTASAGSVWYGAWQKSGKSDTTYEFYYKKSSSASYGSCIKTLTFNNNGTKYKKGDWKLARSRNSQKYDIKVNRTSNKSSKSVLRIDWAVDDYSASN